MNILKLAEREKPVYLSSIPFSLSLEFKTNGSLIGKNTRNLSANNFLTKMEQYSKHYGKQ